MTKDIENYMVRDLESCFNEDQDEVFHCECCEEPVFIKDKCVVNPSIWLCRDCYDEWESEG